jgi:hypothetical protein
MSAASKHTVANMVTDALTFPLPKDKAASQDRWTTDQGVDIAAKGGTPLLAVGSGTIVHHGIGGFGPDAIVLHLDSGQNVYYGHAGPGKRIPDGTRVKAGQQIGEVGAGKVGMSSGPHLEIGLSDIHGTPLGRQTAPGFKNLLLHAKDPGGDGWSPAKIGGTVLGSLVLGPAGTIAGATGLLDAPGQVASDAAGTVAGAPKAVANEGAKLAADAVKSVFGGFFETVKKDAAYGMLFFLLTVGGLVLAAYGTARLFGVQQPVKSTVGLARKTAGVAAVAAA